ncbi:hypothetical protein CK203_080492 [Vitis vinifera]|uniref:Reverse transcriptase domain-containing protein n=1 Tax=Vitis vinifera TaxID=29760 RepID=A0A438E7I6_VITVI|nr:hypothetical protein CK203_080492 [Vitis vinifera]
MSEWCWHSKPGCGGVQSSCSNQLLESLNLIKSKPNVPSEVSNLVTVSQGNVVDSPLGEFQIEGLSPRKMAKVCEVLSSLDIKVYSRRKSRCSTGLGLGSRKKQRVVKDFLRLENSDVVMIQETKKMECDRREHHRRDLLHFEKLYSVLLEILESEGLDWSPISVESASSVQDCWDVIKEDLVRVFAEFHRRLRRVLHETIHSTQGAFVQGRQILHAVLIANEIVDEKRRSVLVNGKAKEWVKASKGLRQSDPLSPFLFTLVADVLSRMLLRAEERNLLEGFREEDLHSLKSLLLVFGHIYGLKVNLDKSNIYASILNKIIFLGWSNCLIARVREGKRDHLVSWDVVCKPKAKKGFEIWEDSSKECRTLREMVVELDSHIVVLGRLFVTDLVFSEARAALRQVKTLDFAKSA